MNSESISSISAFFTDTQPTLELISAASQRETAFAMIAHAGEISVYSKDEPLILALLKAVAKHATWVEGDLVVVIRIRKIGTCALMLLSESGPMREVLKKFDVIASFDTFKEVVKQQLADKGLAPFRLTKMDDEEIVLCAPRVLSIYAPSTTEALREDMIRAPQAPRIPHDLVPSQPPPRPPPLPKRRTATVARVKLVQIAVPLTPSERPVTERPPAPPEESDVDDGWG